MKKHKIFAKCYDRKGKLLSKATNNYGKTHVIQAKFAAIVGQPEKIFLHAEILAIIRAKGKPIHKITVERYGSNGTLLAAPCPICMAAIKYYGIEVVQFTT